MKLSPSSKIAIAASLLFIMGCAGSGHLKTPTGRPQVAVHVSDWKNVSVAIADYNLSKGRELDHFGPNELVLYEAVPSSDGHLQITSKTVYYYTLSNDSLILSSRRFWTDDLEDESASEADDQATFDAEQQELSEIARRIDHSVGESGLANPVNSQ